jgi:hypothetical protein
MTFAVRIACAIGLFSVAPARIAGRMDGRPDHGW